MAKKLYVGGLSYDVTDAKLGEVFSQAGSVVSATVIMDKYSGRSKGFGFVEMSNDEEAAKAINMFNNQEIEGRKVVVNEARPQEERPRGFSNDRRGGGYGDRNRGGGGRSGGGRGRY
ncbi:RNA-binding protein [Candidatus Microgenomates bacterium]|nr:MAG: RNA-binding protein [Candidatus Microgenomates bacterium]